METTVEFESMVFGRPLPGDRWPRHASVAQFEDAVHCARRAPARAVATGDAAH